MANPFDEQYAPKSNPFSEEHAPVDESIWKKAAGVGEGILSTASGMLLGGAAQGIRTLAELPATGDLGEALSRSESSSDAITYEPRTKTGKAVADSINETLSDFAKEYGSKFAGDLSESNKRKQDKGTLTKEDLAGENTEQLVGDILGNMGGPAMGLGSIRGKGKAAPETVVDRIKARQEEIDAAKAPSVNPFDDSQAPVQHELFNPDEQPKGANPYEAQAGYWTKDENGIPIRADLSMEAQNLQNPLQRGLWGDELPARENPVGQSANLPMDRDLMGFEKMTEDPRRTMENDLGMTQALDSMDHLPWRDAKDAAIESLKGELEASGELKAAKMEADTPTTVRSPYTDPFKGPGGKQAGAVNLGSFREGFEKVKELGNGITLKATGEGRSFKVEAFQDGRRIGDADFSANYKDRSFGSKDPEMNAYANMTHVARDQRGNGIATEMYKFAHELGNDISPSPNQTQAGRAMWEGFNRKGAVFDTSTPINKGLMAKQRGALMFGDPAKKQIEKVLGKQDMLSEKPNVDAALEASRGLPDSNSSKNLGSGATLEAMKRRSPAVQALARISQYAQKLGDKNIRDNVLPVERAFRTLARSELKEVAGVLKEEMLRGKRFDPEAIGELSVKQQVAYAHMRTMLDDTLRVQNEQRALKNQPPITHMEAYTSSRWKGDFRRPVFQTILDKAGNPVLDKNGQLTGKLVWYLAADTKLGLDSQMKALKKDHPDLYHDPKQDHVVRSYKRQTDLQTAYSTMIDILGRDDPSLAKIKDYIENQTVNEAASVLGQQKHFETKAGIRGFVGDRPGHSGLGEALEFLQQQIQYAKNAYNWSAIQGVAPELKKLISDPMLREQQPNNAAYMRDYVKNLLGNSEHAAIAAISDAIKGDGQAKKGLGFSPALISRGISNVKSFFIIQKLAGLGQTVSNMIQPVNIIPHLLSSEYGAKRANILTALPVGTAAGMAMATGHFATFLMDIKGARPDALSFYQRAFRYAEDNGITARSIVDESPISSTFSVPGQIGKGLGKFISTPEAYARSIAYMTAVQFLKDSGKFTKDMDLFSKAEDLVNASMVDYRSTERPLMFAKLGGVGDLLNTLQTYPMNWYNQFNLFAREAMKGNPAPFMAFLAIQYGVAGAMGIPGFNDMDKLYQTIKDHVIAKLAPAKYADLQQSEFWTSPKMWMAHHLGSPSVYGALSDATGVALTSRLNTPGASDMIQAPGGPILDLGKQVWNGMKAVANPSRDNIAQVAMASTPVGAQGLVENAPAFKGSTFEDRQLEDGTKQRLAMRPADIGSHTAVYARDDKDTTARLFGFRTQKEAEGREVNYLYGQADKTSKEVVKSIPGEFYAALKNGQMDKAKELYVANTKLTGKGISNAQLETEINQNYMTNVERASTGAKTVFALQSVARMRAMFEQIQKEQGQ